MEAILCLLFFVAGLTTYAAFTPMTNQRSGRGTRKLPILDAEFEPVSTQTMPVALLLPPKTELLQVTQVYRLHSLPPASWPTTTKSWQA